MSASVVPAVWSDLIMMSFLSFLCFAGVGVGLVSVFAPLTERFISMQGDT